MATTELINLAVEVSQQALCALLSLPNWGCITNEGWRNLYRGQYRNASFVYGERTAIFKAVSEGAQDFKEPDYLWANRKAHLSMWCLCRHG